MNSYTLLEIQVRREILPYILFALLTIFLAGAVPQGPLFWLFCTAGAILILVCDIKLINTYRQYVPCVCQEHQVVLDSNSKASFYNELGLILMSLCLILANTAFIGYIAFHLSFGYPFFAMILALYLNSQAKSLLVQAGKMVEEI